MGGIFRISFSLKTLFIRTFFSLPNHPSLTSMPFLMTELLATLIFSIDGWRLNQTNLLRSEMICDVIEATRELYRIAVKRFLIVLEVFDVCTTSRANIKCKLEENCWLNKKKKRWKFSEYFYTRQFCSCESSNWIHGGGWKKKKKKKKMLLKICWEEPQGVLRGTNSCSRVCVVKLWTLSKIFLKVWFELIISKFESSNFRQVIERRMVVAGGWGRGEGSSDNLPSIALNQVIYSTGPPWGGGGGGWGAESRNF